MEIKFKVIFNDGRITFVEYLFSSFNSFSFDMLHYNENEILMDSKLVGNFSVRKAIRNLVSNANKNNASIKIVKRNAHEVLV